LNVAKIWITNDLRADRQNEQWLNAILIKSEER
ncbi:SAM-dependent methyltransferase, partial [Vibrio anguillarum]|nr:SAM-dependent methyltransferase [Vibrio anguillarum]